MNGAFHASPHEVLVARDADEAAALLAELLGRAVVDAVTQRGAARVALSGGTTPLSAYERFASLRLPWSATTLCLVDERAVPPTHPRSNAAAIRTALARGSESLAASRLVDPPHEANLEAAARAYEARLRSLFGVTEAAHFDALTLGIGADGHTASLFPGLGLTGVEDRLVVAVPEQSPLGLEARLSLTAPVLQASRLVVVLALGAGKRAAVAAARAPGELDVLPARALQRARGRVVWVLDEGSAG